MVRSFLTFLGVSAAPVVPSVHAFDDGQIGVFGDVAARADWFYNLDKTYYEPRHSAASATPTRVIYATVSGTGDGLTSGTATSVHRYLTSAGVTPAPGDQVRVTGGTHTIDTTFYSISGTAADPIRFVRHNTAVQPEIINNTSGNSVARFSGTNYVGFHGLLFNGQAGASKWGVTFGKTFDSQTGVLKCSNIDFWHSEVKDVEQETFKIAGASNADGSLSSDLHMYACDIHGTGADGPINQYGELVYTGDGNTVADHVNNVCIEACDLYGARLGEAIDIKQAQTGTVIMGNYIHDIELHSQGAITAQRSEIEARYNIIHDVRESTDITTIPAWTDHYEAYGIVAQGGIIDHCVGWDIGGAMVGYYDHTQTGGSNNIAITNTTAWNTRLDNPGYQSDMISWGTSGGANGIYPTASLVDSVTDDGVGTSEAGAITNPANAAAADFVGPVTGTADAGTGPGSGFQLANGSSIPATSGALGKA